MKIVDHSRANLNILLRANIGTSLGHHKLQLKPSVRGIDHRGMRFEEIAQLELKQMLAQSHKKRISLRGSGVQNKTTSFLRHSQSVKNS